jgi:hypothetical protein
METVSAQVASKLSIRRTKGESPLLRTSRQKLAGGISRLESALERRRGLSTLDTIKSLSRRLRPDARKFEAPVRSNPTPWPSPRDFVISSHGSEARTPDLGRTEIEAPGCGARRWLDDGPIGRTL